jgi:hypothetical protein
MNQFDTIDFKNLKLHYSPVNKNILLNSVVLL